MGRSEPSCDQTQFLHPNGTCVACPVCGPGQQLSEDCGFGDGGTGLCVVCGRGYFSVDAGVAQCIRCTQCILLNRQQRATCTAFNNAQCGHCLPGYYELRSMRGEVELPCVPCNNLATIHKSCLLLKRQDSKAQETQSRTVSMVLVGSATAASTFLIILMLWTFLLAVEQFKQEPNYGLGPDDLLSGSGLVTLVPQTSSAVPASPKHPAATHPQEPHTQLMAPPLSPPPTPSELMPLSQKNEVPPASIVINVTTNIKPSGQSENEPCGETGRDSRYSTQQMEQHLQTIWDTAQGQSIDLLDYDAVQDLSLLLGSADHRGSALRRLARSLGVPPQILAHLHSFSDLFHYLRTSTYLLLPQLAQAAALLPCPGVVARIHQAVMNK
ncbi:unnamed protein product [Lota lota]